MPGVLVQRSSDLARLDEPCSPLKELKRSTTDDLTKNSALSSREKTELIRQKLATWINGHAGVEGLSSDAQYRAHVSKRHPGTAEWLYDTESFKTWLQVRKPLPLMLTALAGSGKTVMASAVAQRLREEGYLVSIFYYSATQGKKSAENLLRALAHDLLMLSEIIPNDLMHLYHTEIADGHLVLDNMLKSVRVVEILLKTIKRVHIIVDGLDECQDRNRMFEILELLLQAKTYGVVKWLFTSRPDYRIRTKMALRKVVELEAPSEAIRTDIRKFVSDKTALDVNESFNKLYGPEEEMDSNFLWALVIVDMMQGIQNVAATTEALEVYDDADDLPIDPVIAPIVAKIMGLPRSLNSLYVRSLNSLASMSADRQKMAKKLLAFVVAAEQPLKVSELGHALVTSSRTTDYSTVKLPTAAQLASLGADLLVIDHSTDPDDPTVRMPHKSTLEFIAEDKHTPGLLPAARQFLTNEDTANRMLGEACIQYLTHPRYESVHDIPSLLQHKDHAFLNYAAMCWHKHLNYGKPSTQQLSRVQDFMQSPCFWTTVAVQSYVSPFAFARYIEDGKQLRSVLGNQILPTRTAKVQWGLPLPWYLQSSRARSFLEMIIQWHHVLNTYADNVESCRMDSSWELKWPEYWRWIVRVKGPLKTVSSLPDDKDYLLVKERLSFSRPARLCCAVREALRIFDRPPTDPPQQLITCYCAPCSEVMSDQGIDNTLIEDSTIGRAMEFYYLTSVLRNRTSELATPLDEKWLYADFYTNITVGSASIQSVPMLAVQFAQLHEQRTQVGDTSQRITVGIRLISHEKGYKFDTQALMTVKQHCLVVSRRDHSTLQHFWTSTYRMLHARPAFHPRKPWVAWTPAPSKLCLVRDSTVEEYDLPEPDVDVSKEQMMYRELRFSSDGQQLWCITFTIYTDDTEMRHVLLVTEYRIEEGFKLEIVKTNSLKYSSCGTVIAPGIFTVWLEDYVFIVMPPLASRPKVVRVSLTTPSTDFETLREPIFLPSTTLLRQPRFVGWSSATEDMLVLLLAAEIPLPAADKAALPDGAYRSGLPDDAILQGSYRLAWKLNRSTDWRLWDADIDAHSEEYKILMAAVENFQGSYVPKGRPLPVVTRSGLDWTKQAQITCECV